MLSKLENERLDDDLTFARSLKQLSSMQVSDTSEGIRAILYGMLCAKLF